MFSEFVGEVSDFIDVTRLYYLEALKWLGVLWLINIINWKFLHRRLNVLGIYPRHPIGLVGIIFAPILHGDFTHLLFNSIPLFFLSILMMSLSVPIFYEATIIIAVLSGFAVWCIGRKGIHIGASALISGYFGFVLGMAYRNPTFTTFFCAALALYYFGGILLSLFPSEEKMSWEGHLSGFIAGLVALYITTSFPLLF